MGGEGSGNWYRFDKKTTTSECHSMDVRYLHREGLLKPGRWFTLRWSRRTGNGFHPQCSDRGREAGGGYPNLPPPERSRQRMGKCKGVHAPHLDCVQLRRRETVVHLSGSWMRSEGSSPLRSGTLLSM